MENTIKCPKCKSSKTVVGFDVDTNYFSYDYKGEHFLSKRNNKEEDFLCFACNYQFKEAKRWKKGQVLEALTVDVDFSEFKYNVKFVSRKEKRKSVIWIEIFNGRSNTYFAKVWGEDLVKRIEEEDFSEGSVWTAELRLETNKKDSEKGSSFMCLHFNSETVNMRDDF